jgi:hypothetical protein
MNPYHHAVSSQRQYGGTISDYLPIHNWFDLSKSSLAFFTHRCINHHREGIGAAVRLFGSTIINADNAAVSVETIALQHLAEDMSIIPSAADWLLHLQGPASDGPAASDIPSPERLAAMSARHFNTDPAAMFPLHSWFLETATWFTDARHLAIRHNSFGIFEAERQFGYVLGQDTSSPVPTRVAGEWHVRTVMCGRIPAAADFLRRIKGQPWMAASHKARRRGLC